jgi:hypothetical protein
MTSSENWPRPIWPPFSRVIGLNLWQSKPPEVRLVTAYPAGAGHRWVGDSSRR